MKKMSRIFILVVLIAPAFLGNPQPLYAQTSVHDSLRQMMKDFRELTQNQKLKQALDTVQKMYRSDQIDDSLSTKLVDLEGMLLSSSINKQKVLVFDETLTRILSGLAPAGGHPDYAYSLDYLGGLYERFGFYKKALPLYQKAFMIKQAALGAGHPNCATSLHNLGRLYGSLNDYDQARIFYMQAQQLFKQTLGEEHHEYTFCLTNLANLYMDMGFYNQALPLYQQVLATKAKLQQDDIESLQHLSYLYYRIGQYDEALTYCNRSLTILKNKSWEETSAYASGLNLLSNLYEHFNRYDEAVVTMRQALDITEKLWGIKNIRYATELSNLAVLYLSHGQYDKSLPLLEQVLSVRKNITGEEDGGYLVSLSNLALVYQKVGKLDTALSLCQYVLEITKKIMGGNHPEYANCLNRSGTLDYTMGKDQDASEKFMTANSIKLRFLDQTFSSLSEHEKLGFMKREAYQFNYLPSVLMGHLPDNPGVTRQTYQNELALKGMVLQDQHHLLKSIRQSTDTGTVKLYDQWRESKEMIARQLLLPLKKRVPFLDSLQERNNQLEQELSRRAAGFKYLEGSRSITLDDISQKLQRGQAAVEFIRFQLYNKRWTDSVIYAALVVRPGDSLCKFIPLCEEKQLKRLTRPAAIRDTGKLNDSLCNLIWKPLEKYLAGVNTIYYAPTGLLHRVAFQSLHTNRSGFLIERYQLNQVFSTHAVALPVEISSKPALAAVWGNINYGTHTGEMLASRGSPSPNETVDTAASAFNLYADDTRGLRGKEWPSLPGTVKEMDSLCRLFKQAGIGIVADSGTIATEEAFKALDGKSPKVLHLATHGFFLPVAENKIKNDLDFAEGKDAFTTQENPMFRSGLVLAGGNRAWKGEPAVPGKEDGILTAYEIAQMDLSNTDLVVLSACETALGDIQGNEGVIGLQRAFKIAGVKQIIMSLWKVPDIETMKLMTLFYRNWLGGLSTREALRAAQLKMKEKYPPYYWAAFVLVE